MDPRCPCGKKRRESDSSSHISSYHLRSSRAVNRSVACLFCRLSGSAMSTEGADEINDVDPDSHLPRRRSFFRPTQFPRGPMSGPYVEPRDKINDVYVHNTRVLCDGRDNEGIVRHCYRRASSGRMKCLRCFDYNFWVARGSCSYCGFDRFDTTPLSNKVGGFMYHLY